MDEKPWWQSRTYWLNLASGALNFFTALAMVLLVVQSQDWIQAHNDWVPFFTLAINVVNTIVAVINALLRWGGNAAPLSRMFGGGDK